MFNIATIEFLWNGSMKIFYKAEIMIYIIDFVLSKKENPKRICQLILSGFRSLIYVISENKNPPEKPVQWQDLPGAANYASFFLCSLIKPSTLFSGMPRAYENSL